MIQVQCLSVAGGWQTVVKETGYTFGPIYNSITDLWKWQRVNLFNKPE
jgi:hypothetical protein